MMTLLLLLFDLDETLLAGTGKVPRPTWYSLQWHAEQGTTVLGVVTNNMLGYNLVSATGLAAFIPLENVLVKKDRDETRAALIARWLEAHPREYARIVFFDDRLDNIQNVQEHLPHIHCVLVPAPQELGALIKKEGVVSVFVGGGDTAV
jgi:hypothetical protein